MFSLKLANQWNPKANSPVTISKCATLIVFVFLQATTLIVFPVFVCYSAFTFMHIQAGIHWMLLLESLEQIDFIQNRQNDCPVKKSFNNRKKSLLSFRLGGLCGHCCCCCWCANDVGFVHKCHSFVQLIAMFTIKMRRRRNITSNEMISDGWQCLFIFCTIGFLGTFFLLLLKSFF